METKILFSKVCNYNAKLSEIFIGQAGYFANNADLSGGRHSLAQLR